jgi:hypothetical protein
MAGKRPYSVATRQMMSLAAVAAVVSCMVGCTVSGPLAWGGSVSAGIALGVFASVVVIATIAYFRWWPGKSSRFVSVSEGAPAVVWNGGLRTQTVHATSGTARLEMFDWGVRVRGRGMWRRLLPTWEVRYGELTTAQVMRWPIANSGVLMRTDGSAAPLVFVTLRDSEVLEALAVRGVPVDHSVTRLRQADLADSR